MKATLIDRLYYRVRSMSTLMNVAAGIGAFVAVGALAIITGNGGRLIVAVFMLALLGAYWIPTMIAVAHRGPNWRADKCDCPHVTTHLRDGIEDLEAPG
jgi:hypothetical protein